MNTNLALLLFAIFLIAVVAVIVMMFVSLAKQGDERRKMIVEKASAGTFAATVLYLLFHIAENIYKVISQTDMTPEGMNPVVTLTVIAVIYAFELIYHKKKYGD